MAEPSQRSSFARSHSILNMENWGVVRMYGMNL